MVNFDRSAYLNDNYIGKRWRGIAAYTEQAYLRYSTKYVNFMVGRDFIRWGPSKNGTLVLSNITRPLDQFNVSFHFGIFKYSFLTSQLDPYPYANVDSIVVPIRRYISGHRLDVSLIKNRLQIGISEIILYGGPGRNIDFTYLNPFIFYHGAHKNNSDETNVLPTLDIMFYPTKKINIHSSILIDDIQIEKTGPGDLEPNEIGIIAGLNWSDPLNVLGSNISFEYVRVTNRTYKTPNLWETFIHRNEPLGHPLGNDFDHWQVGLSKWFFGKARAQIRYSQTRKGEGSIYTPWDNPWSEYTVEEGYSEPFPTGVVEKRNQMSFLFDYYASTHWGIEGELHFMSRDNAYNIEGATSSDTMWRIGAWFDGDVVIKLKD